MDWNLFWSAIGAVGGLVGTVLGGVALIYAVHTYRESMLFSHYSELDQTYFVLLAMAVEQPWLRTPAQIEDEYQLEAYGTYAFMVWNFLETIFDRCDASPELKETWYPIILTESRLHRDWFNLPENRPNFKERFQQFVDAGLERLS